MNSPDPVATTPVPAIPAIEMRGVSVSAMSDPGKVVVEGIDWTVNPGEFWAVAGLRGAGKTEFLMMTAGLSAPVKGTYRLFGAEMPLYEESRLAERLKLGLVFDDGHLFNLRTVFENVSLPLRYHHNLSEVEAEPEVRRLLDVIELSGWADSTPGGMPLSWRKRVALARAIILRPSVLLIDNALGGLDARDTRWWLGLLDSLTRGKGPIGEACISVIVTTNDLRIWEGHAGRFAALSEGRFTVLGNWEEVRAMQHELLRELLPGRQPAQPANAN